MFMIGVVKVNAQMKYGINAGVNYSTLKGQAMSSFNNIVDLSNGVITTQPKIGFHAGGFVEMPLGANISLQPGVYYSQKGYMLKGNLTPDKFDFLGVTARAQLQSHYIDIPVLVKAEVAKGLQVFAGPQVSYLVKSNLKMDAGLLGFSLVNTNLDVTNQFNKADFAVTGGASYTFDNGFSINAAYDHGLSRLDRNSNLKSYNRTFKVGVGFTF
jgi:hypothetical protein